MDSNRRGARWFVRVGWLPAALCLLGCAPMHRVVHEPAPAAVAIVPEPDSSLILKPSMPSPLVAVIPDLPLPRIKPPLPKTAATADGLGSKVPLTELGGRIVRIQPAELVGFDFSSIREVLRRPDDVQSSALSVVWVYTESMCTLRLFFYPDIQTRIFHLLKYDVRGMSGERLNDSSLCMQKLAAARKDESEEP